MIRPDQIPDEVVEAAARADYEMTRAEAIYDHGAIAETMYCPWEEVSPDAKKYYMDHARAAIAAALSAWPAWAISPYAPVEIGKDYIILPLPPKNGDT